MTAVLLALSGCQTVDGEKKDISSSAQQGERTPVSASPQKVTHQGRETDPIKQQINAYVDPVSKRNSDELSYAYDRYKPKFSARMRQLRDKYNLSPQKYDVLLTIGNDGIISDCDVRNGEPSATAAMREDMCYAWSWVFFGKKIPSLPPYMVSIQTPIPEKQAQASQTAESSENPGTVAPTHKVQLVDTVKTADAGEASQPVPVQPTLITSPGPSGSHRTSHQFELSPPTP